MSNGEGTVKVGVRRWTPSTRVARIVAPLLLGLHIGPYQILEPLGEGGTGMVYVADQIEPVKRKVALKLIKPGMDSKQVVARFEAERQALAVMDHPNIATVLDGGVSSAKSIEASLTVMRELGHRNGASPQ